MIFKFSGNFTEDGSWSTPDPAFEGEILIADNGALCGYCTDFAESKVNSVVYEEKFIIGSLGLTGKQREGIAFWKFSNYPYYTPKMYLVPDFKNSDFAIWAERDESGALMAQGEARLTFRKLVSYEDELESIKARFEQLNTLEQGRIKAEIEHCINAIKSVHYCKA